MGQRIRGASEDQVERALARGSILGPTWHYVLPDVIPWLLKLTALHVRAPDTYYDRQLVGR